MLRSTEHEGLIPTSAAAGQGMRLTLRAPERPVPRVGGVSEVEQKVPPKEEEEEPGLRPSSARCYGCRGGARLLLWSPGRGSAPVGAARRGGCGLARPARLPWRRVRPAHAESLLGTEAEVGWGRSPRGAAA